MEDEMSTDSRDLLSKMQLIDLISFTLLRKVQHLQGLCAVMQHFGSLNPSTVLYAGHVSGQYAVIKDDLQEIQSGLEHISSYGTPTIEQRKARPKRRPSPAKRP
jgi:hypothetical protein